MSAEPRFDIDFKVGQQAEFWVSDIIQALATGRVEVKRDRKYVETGRIYVEFECFRRGEWRPSGISTSESPVWVFVLTDDGLSIIVNAERLKQMVQAARDRKAIGEEKDGSHPTRGALIGVAHLFAMFVHDMKGDWSA